MVEVLLRDHLFSRNLEGRESLVAYYDDVGEVFIDNWEHIFPTKTPIDKLEADYLEEELLKEYPDKVKRFFGRSGDVLQVYLPKEFGTELPEVFVGSSKKDQKKFSMQVNMRFGFQGQYHDYDQAIVESLKRANEVRASLQNWHLLLESKLDLKPGQVTRIINSIDECFLDESNEVTKKWNEIQKKYPDLKDTLLEQRLEIAKLAEKVVHEEVTLKFGKRKNRFEYETHLSSPELYTHRRSMNAGELRDAKLLFIDIEFPRFDEEDKEISWIGMETYHQGKREKIIFTLRDTGVEMVNQYNIVKSVSEKSLIEDAAKWIQQSDPLVVIPFNAPVDVYLPHEFGAFSIGRSKSNPYKRSIVYDHDRRAVNRFLDDVKIRGRMTLDLMRIYRTGLSFLRNRNLKVVAKYMLDHDMVKDYQLLKDQETDAKNGNQKQARDLAQYLSEDVGQLVPLFLNSNFPEALTLLSSVAQVPMEVLCERPSRIGRMREQAFFKGAHFYKRTLYPSERAAQEETSKKLESLLKSVLPKSDQNKTYSVMVPFASAFVDHLKNYYKDYGERPIQDLFEATLNQDWGVPSRIFVASYLRALVKDPSLNLVEYNRLTKLRDKLQGGQQLQLFDDVSLEDKKALELVNHKLDNLSRRVQKQHWCSLEKSYEDLLRRMRMVNEKIVKSRFIVGKSTPRYLGIYGRGDVEKLRSYGYIVANSNSIEE